MTIRWICDGAVWSPKSGLFPAIPVFMFPFPMPGDPPPLGGGSASRTALAPIRAACCRSFSRIRQLSPGELSHPRRLVSSFARSTKRWGQAGLTQNETSWGGKGVLGGARAVGGPTRLQPESATRAPITAKHQDRDGNVRTRHLPFPCGWNRLLRLPRFSVPPWPGRNRISRVGPKVRGPSARFRPGPSGKPREPPPRIHRPGPGRRAASVRG